jgi:hypothetical protein
VLQVLLRAQFGDPISGELPLQGAPEALPIFQASAAPVSIAIRRIGQVEQRQGAGEGTEPLNLNVQPSPAFPADAPDPANQIFRVVPTLDGDDAATGG